MFSADVHVAVQHGQNLYVSNRVWDEDCCLMKDSFKLEKPLNDKDEVVISLEDGTVFGIRKQQSTNDVGHSYWGIYVVVPPLEYCTIRFAGRDFSDELWSTSPVEYISVNGEKLYGFSE